VLVGGTGTGTTHLAIAIALARIRGGAHGRRGRIADQLSRLNSGLLAELGYLPFAQSSGQRLFHLNRRFYEQASVIVSVKLPSANGPPSSATRCVTHSRDPTRRKSSRWLDR